MGIAVRAHQSPLPICLVDTVKGQNEKSDLILPIGRMRPLPKPILEWKNLQKLLFETQWKSCLSGRVWEENCGSVFPSSPPPYTHVWKLVKFNFCGIFMWTPIKTLWLIVCLTHTLFITCKQLTSFKLSNIWSEEICLWSLDPYNNKYETEVIYHSLMISV